MSRAVCSLLHAAVDIAMEGADPDEFVGDAISLVRNVTSASASSAGLQVDASNAALTRVVYEPLGWQQGGRRLGDRGRNLASPSDALFTTVRMLALSTADANLMVANIG